MKVLRYYTQRDVRFEELEIPEPKADEVRIRVSDVGLCQTQINEFVEGPYLINQEPHPLTQKAIPLIPGHEYGGVVDKVGIDSLSDLIGKQVAVLPLISCGECEYCHSGDINLCNSFAYYGLSGEDGGLADYSVVKKENIIEVEKQELLTYIEPILVAIHTSEMMNEYKDGDSVLIIGAGAIGIALASVLQDYAKRDIIITDSMDARLNRANEAGFKTITKDELIDKKYTFVIDCAGSDTYNKSSAIIEAFNYLQKKGTVIGLGTYFHTVNIEPIGMLVIESKMIWSFLYNRADLELLPKVLESITTDFSIFNEDIEIDNIIDDGYFRAEVDKDSFTRLVVKC